MKFFHLCMHFPPTEKDETKVEMSFLHDPPAYELCKLILFRMSRFALSLRQVTLCIRVILFLLPFFAYFLKPRSPFALVDDRVTQGP
mmetsp:Transcript_24161/g.47499  ORF Transcript_24161/g.47499 Transcript_24161/m.47499 type:complete len:87 (-) Transcript_24161:191-451(-)